LKSPVKAFIRSIKRGEKKILLKNLEPVVGALVLCLLAVAWSTGLIVLTRADGLTTGTAEAQHPKGTTAVVVDDIRKILILHSYQQGQEWTDNIMEGIRLVLAQSGFEPDVYIEYMDTVRYGTGTIFPALENLYRTKYGNTRFDVIIISDNSALTFLLAHRNALFSDAPVVFCGINNFTDDLISGQRQITGITEDYDLVGTVRLALSLQPVTKHIAVIRDSTPSGKLPALQLVMARSEFPDVDFIELTDWTLAELKDQLGALPRDTAIIRFGLNRDRSGAVFSTREGIERVSDSGLPVYSMWDTHIHYGTIGGLVVSGREQGKQAAGMAVRIIRGESVDAIPVMHPSPNIPMFDYNALTRFNLPVSKVPKDSIILNKPELFYDRYKTLIWAAGGVAFLQAITIVFLLVNISVRRQTERALRRSNRELRAISDCNQVLVRAEDEQVLLNDICNIICTEAGYRLVWVGYAEHDNAKSVRPVAWAGFDSAYVANAQLSWADDTERGRGPGGTAIRSGEIVYIQDFTTDPRMAPWRENALQRGYRSVIALPLKDGTANVFGVLLIYSAETHAFTPEEIRLLEELVGDLAFGIMVLRTRTERKRAEEALKRIEWMLSKKHTVAMAEDDQGYGDLTALNHDGIILKSVGPDVLRSIAADYLDLLGTSSAIYEINGDYAFGIFASNWCRMLDRASRKLCNTADNTAALSSGQWLCHESCWTCCSKAAIATRAPVDIECSGGIRLYGVPIIADETVIGSINFGYGDIPQDPVKLQALANAYHLNEEDLLAECNSYDSRPPYIVEMAKSRLHASARLIGALVERRRAESEILTLNQELEQRVADRTVQLEAANKELESFAYSVSHDLRTPLRHITGFMELLKETLGTTPDEQGRHYMDTISNAARKMGMLIDDLLSFSCMRRQAMSFQPVAPGDLVRDIIRDLEPDISGRTIDWHIGELPMVYGDAAMLKMALNNLISNALKFTRPRHETRIDIGSVPGQTAETVIYVRDNGVGFDMTYADKLFGMFQRLHRADEFEGTGIGLANVHRIITRHGGRVWAEGKLDQGAVFYFSLPQKQQGDNHATH
jgi:signal transduction histidine kinase/ABC-type uncharacterized transport system substrate-binding protein/putative methionine-R-sulfoxide reductase with GAF domain